MTDADERFVVTVSDHAPAAPARPAAPAGDGGIHDGAGHDGAARDATGDEAFGYEAFGYDGGTAAIPAGFGLALISGLAEDVRVLSTSSGVSVRMSWPSTAAAS